MKMNSQSQNANDVRWLRACIWPEERWRYDLLDAVLAVAQQDLHWF